MRNMMAFVNFLILYDVTIKIQAEHQEHMCPNLDEMIFTCAMAN